MRKSKFVFLSHQDQSLIRFRLPLMRALKDQGHVVTAVCPVGDYCARFAEHGIGFHEVSFDRRGMNPSTESLTILRLARLLRRLSPDVLHAFVMKANIYGALAATAARVPIRIASVTGLGSLYIRNPASWGGRIGRKALDVLYGRSLRLVDAVIFLNSEDREQFIRLGIAAPEKAVLMPGEGVDTHYFTAGRGKLGGALLGDKVVVTMIARLIRDKGISEFLTAAERLKARFGEKILCRLVGAPDSGNVEPFSLERVSRLHRLNVIEYLGFQEDIRGILESTDIFALPSYREGMPVSILEAMSMGLPVVTTDAPGCRDAVAHGVNGLLVPVRDAAALASALEKLILHPELRNRFGIMGRYRANENFSLDRVIRSYFALYSRLSHASPRMTGRRRRAGSDY